MARCTTSQAARTLARRRVRKNRQKLRKKGGKTCNLKQAAKTLGRKGGKA